MDYDDIKLKVHFYKANSGAEPVRKQLKLLPLGHKKVIGEDIRTVQFGWPLGMPLVEKIKPFFMGSKDGIARVLFTVDGNIMILLHGFIKKSQEMELRNISKTALAKEFYGELFGWTFTETKTIYATPYIVIHREGIIVGGMMLKDGNVPDDVIPVGIHISQHVALIDTFEKNALKLKKR